MSTVLYIGCLDAGIHTNTLEPTPTLDTTPELYTTMTEILLNITRGMTFEPPTLLAYATHIEELKKVDESSMPHQQMEITSSVLCVKAWMGQRVSL